MDEVTDIKTLMSYIPDASELNQNIYLLLVSRTNNELAEVSRSLMNGKAITASLEFLRDHISRYEYGVIEDSVTGNEHYHRALETYVDSSFLDNNEARNRRLIEKFEYRFSEVTAYKRLCKMNPAFKNVVDTDLMKVFIDELKLNAPKAYFHKVEMILNALAWSGASLSIRELAYLSGEQYVSYKFVGMLYDLQAFIRNVRTEKGNCYEFAHGEWEQSVKEKFPYGAIYFRKLCNKLLEEIEAEPEGKDFLADENQGELWLLANLLRLYNDSSEQLKKNWFEDVKIDNVAEMWARILQKLSVDSNLDVTTVRGRKVLSIISQVWDDYDSAARCFRYDTHNGIACSTSNVTKSRLAKVLMKSLSVKQTIVSLAEENEYYASASICKSLGKIFDRNANGQFEPEMKKNCALLADECYSQACFFYNKLSDVSRTPDVIEMLYRSGRVCQIGGLTDRAKEYYEAALKIILEYTCEENSKVALYAARTHARYGLLLNDSEEQFDYYLSAEKLLCGLIQKSCEAEYLDWRAWLYNLMAKWNEEKEELNKARLYWEAALSDAEKLYDIRGTYEDRNDFIRVMDRLSDIYISYEKWEQALPLLIRLVEKEEAIEYLSKLSKVYDKLKMYPEKRNIDARLLPLEQKRAKYADAAYEVLELVKYLPESAYKKIPTAQLDHLRKLANYSHIFKIDPSDPFESAHVSVEAKAIMTCLIRDYFSTDMAAQNIHQLLELKQCILGLEFLDSVMSYSEGKQISFQGDHSFVYNEVVQGLQRLPRRILMQIPMQVLLDIDSKMSMSFVKTKEYKEIDDYSGQAISIIKELVSLYTSDSVINEIRAEAAKQRRDELVDTIVDDLEYE